MLSAMSMPMFNTLYAKLSATLVILLISVGIFYTLLSLSSASFYLQEAEQKINFDLAKNLVQDKNLVQKGAINQKALSSTFMEYMVINPSIEIYLLDLEGKIISYSAESGKVKRHSVALQPIIEFLNEATLPLLGDDPRSHDKQKIFSVTQIPNKNSPEYYLYVVLQGEQYNNVEQFIKESTLWKQTGFALLGSLIIGLLIGLLIFRKLTYRLNRLSRDIDSFRSSNFSQLAIQGSHKKNGDEINQLENAFKQMGERIVSQIDESKKQDNLRRELIANVSHDLRTPFAILHAYLETLDLKAKNLSTDEQANYIKQALKSSEQLSLLITELFELAKLDATETIIATENINLPELAHDVIQKFQLRALENKISLHLEVSSESIFCHAEIRLIARALENLISNAIKFTPQHGTITISINEEKDKIVTTISDTGTGIEPKDINNIFQRFYQGRTDHNRSKPGGLGLAIVKRIIELHQGEISVSSSDNGSTFQFILPQNKKNKLPL